MAVTFPLTKTGLRDRVTIKLGDGEIKVKKKTVKVIYLSFMLRTTAEYLGLKEYIPPKVSRGKLARLGRGKREITARGSFRAGSISIPGAGKTLKGNQKMLRIPIPGPMTIGEVKAFLRKVPRNKPKKFTSVDGITHSVG
jgi:hypothetical protein